VYCQICDLLRENTDFAKIAAILSVFFHLP